MKVLLTTARCNPPLTRTYECAEARYFENKHKVSMYDKKGKLIAYAITDEWQAVVFEKDNKTYVIK